ncbi:hypothetical protein BGZ58_001970 [Dissophora ornata]|nr:hypothetical protein BGZ58_001970 [Dissophora ornata]
MDTSTPAVISSAQASDTVASGTATTGPVSIPEPGAGAGLTLVAEDVTPTIIHLLQVRLAALEARLEASERQDALLDRILALEKKQEEKAATPTTAETAVADAAAAAATAAVVAITTKQPDWAKVLEKHLSTIEYRMSDMKTYGTERKIGELISPLQKIAFSVDSAQLILVAYFAYQATSLVTSLFLSA